MALTYLVGARQSGKTYQLIERAEKGALFISPNVAMARHVRKQLGDSVGVVSYSSLPIHFMPTNGQTVLVDEANFLPEPLLVDLITHSQWSDMVFAFTPFRFDFDHIPAIIKWWCRATVVSLNKRMSDEDLEYIRLRTSSDYFQREMLGRWLVDGD